MDASQRFVERVGSEAMLEAVTCGLVDYANDPFLKNLADEELAKTYPYLVSQVGEEAANNAVPEWHWNPYRRHWELMLRAGEEWVVLEEGQKRVKVEGSYNVEFFLWCCAPEGNEGPEAPKEGDLDCYIAKMVKQYVEDEKEDPPDTASQARSDTLGKPDGE